MDFNGVIEFTREAEKMGKDIEDPRAYSKAIEEIQDYLERTSETGQKLILERMDEETPVRFIRAAKATLMASMFLQGCGFALLMAEAEDDLDGFTHTMILSVIGALFEKEVI